jgi:hypothetical protein
MTRSCSKRLADSSERRGPKVLGVYSPNVWSFYKKGVAVELWSHHVIVQSGWNTVSRDAPLQRSGARDNDFEALTQVIFTSQEPSVAGVAVVHSDGSVICQIASAVIRGDRCHNFSGPATTSPINAFD